MTNAKMMRAAGARGPGGGRRGVVVAVTLVIAFLGGSCTSSDSKDDGGASAAEAGAETAASTMASIVIESTDGSAFAGSRTWFVLTDQNDVSRLVAVEGTVSGAATTVPLEPGTYRIAPSATVQMSPTASYAVRDLSAREVVVPEAEDGADLSEPVARVQFGLDVERSPFDVGVDEMTATTAAFSWSALEGATVASYEARLTEGTDAATGRDDGTEIALSSPTATSVVVTGLEAGREYTVTLFAADAGGKELAFRSLSVTTPTADGSEPAFALAPNTIVPTDFDDLDPKLLDDGTVSVTLGSSREQRSTTAIPGVEGDDLATGCVVGTPLLVSSEVAGDDAFYGVIASCGEDPAAWRGQQGGGEVKDVVARLDTGVPLAAIVPFLSFHSTGYERCAVKAGAAGPDDPDPCAAADRDQDGMSDTTEVALGLDPADGASNWASRVASGGTASGTKAPVTPVGDLEAPAGLAAGPLQVTVLWATGDDLDLTVTDPTGEVVAGQTGSASGGRMDRTDDGDPSCRSTDTRAENAVWAAAPPEGTYSIEVANFTGTAEAPRSSCGTSVQARVQVRVGGEIKSDHVLKVGDGCPTTIEVIDGEVKDSGFIASACSFDGERWRMVGGLADTSGDGQASKGDTVRFFEYPTAYDGSTYEKIPLEDCVVTEFEAAFTGPPDLRVRGKTCSAYFRSERNPKVKLHQERFGADNRIVAGGRPGPGKFDLDLWDVIRVPKSNTEDRIEESDSDTLVEQLSVRDDPFIRVDISFVPARPSGWRGAPQRGAPTTSRAKVLGAPAVKCESDGKATFLPRFGMDKFHDVAITLKKTKLTWDVNAGIVAHVEPLIEVESSYECGLDLDGVSVQLVTVPIPITLEIAPSLSGGVEGSADLTGPKLDLTLGVDTEGFVDASVETCSPLWFLPDVPCGLDLDTKFEGEPIAGFARGDLNGSMKATITAGVGAEATIAVGTENAFVTAKAGFAITLEPLAATLTGSGTTPLTSAPPTTAAPTTTGPGTAELTLPDHGPPYNHAEYTAIYIAQTRQPAARDADGVAFVGPTSGDGCVARDRHVVDRFRPQDDPAWKCPDAKCMDSGTEQPIFTTSNMCNKAICYVGGNVVNTGGGDDLIAECSQGPIGSSTDPPGPSDEASPAGDKEDGSLCVDASIGANLSVDFNAEFWVLAFGDEREYPIYEQDVPYPGAKFQLGTCKD